MNKYFFLGAVAMFLLGSCGHPQGENEEEHHHSHEAEAHSHEGHSDEIILTPEKARKAGVEVSVVEPTTFHQVIRTSGQLLAAQGDERTIVAPVAGTVRLSGQVVEGSRVATGTRLLLVSASGLADGDPVQKARVAYETAKREYERMKPLAESQIVSAKDFAATEQAYENARISYEALAQGHGDDGQTITAPMTGYVKQILVQEGDYVNVGQPLISLTQNQRLFLRADVSERYYAQLPTIRSAHFSTPYNNKVYDLDQLDGRLVSYGKATEDYFLPVTFELNNRGDMVPGSFVEVWLLSTPMEGVIALPYGAISEEQGSYFVYRQLDEEGYEKQPVTLGADDGERVVVVSGVAAGDRIVTREANQVKLAAASNAIPAHTHEH